MKKTPANLTCVPCCMSSQHDERQHCREAATVQNSMLLKTLAVLALAFCHSPFSAQASCLLQSLQHVQQVIAPMSHQEHSRKFSLIYPQLQYCDIIRACAVQQGAFSDLEDLLDASHKLVEESVDSRARSQQASPAVTRDSLRQVPCHSCKLNSVTRCTCYIVSRIQQGIDQTTVRNSTHTNLDLKHCMFQSI